MTSLPWLTEPYWVLLDPGSNFADLTRPYLALLFSLFIDDIFKRHSLLAKQISSHVLQMTIYFNSINTILTEPISKFSRCSFSIHISDQGSNLLHPHVSPPLPLPGLSWSELVEPQGLHQHQPELVILPAVDEDVGAGVGDQQQVRGAGEAGRPVRQLGR